jgi:hypothetical protein
MKMKSFFLKSFFLVLISGLMFSSCKKDSTKTEDIVGTWTAGTSTLSVMVGDKTLTQYFIDVMELPPADAQTYTDLVEQVMAQSFAGTITIKSNGTYTATLGGDADSGTWSLNGDKTELTIISSVDGPMTFDVVQLTSNKLQIHGIEVTSEDLNGDDIPESMHVDVEINFSK